MLRFGPFTFDLDCRQLRKDGVDLPLPPKAFDLLAVLIDERPRPVSKQAIFERLWPDTFVTDNGLATVVADLRAALGDTARLPKCIRTIHRHGYAFIAEVVDANTGGTAAAWLLVRRDREVPVGDGVHILGRAGPGVIALESPTVSRHHARLVIRGEAVTVEDLGSKNGTWVDDRAAGSPTPVPAGASIRLGRVVLTLRRRSGPLSTASAITDPCPSS